MTTIQYRRMKNGFIARKTDHPYSIEGNLAYLYAVGLVSPHYPVPATLNNASVAITYVSQEGRFGRAPCVG